MSLDWFIPTTCVSFVVNGLHPFEVVIVLPLAGSADVVGDVPVPIARANVVGTPWFEVKCSDGRRYYFNNDTQVSSRMKAQLSWRISRQATEKVYSPTLLMRMTITGHQQPFPVVSRCFLMRH